MAEHGAVMAKEEKACRLAHSGCACDYCLKHFYGDPVVRSRAMEERMVDDELGEPAGSA
jgi:hypothetical protein